jgi:ubiquitin C-terminal hydrolase
MNSEKKENSNEIKFLFDTHGFRNTNSSCFADTILASMYFYKYSPFYSFLESNWKFSDYKHSSDKQKDITIRKKIQTVLNHTLERMTDTVSFRTIIELYFKWRTDGGHCLQNGQQDPNEFYDRIIKVFDFDPITVTTVRQSKVSEHGNIIKEKPVTEKMSFITIPNDNTSFDGFERLRYPLWEDLGEDSSNWKNNLKSEKTYRWTRNMVSSIQGNSCLVFYINRTAVKYENGEIIGFKTYNKITMPSKIQNYFLFSCIVHIGTINGGHYIAILSDGEHNYLYDDVNIQKINDSKIQDNSLIYTNGVMFFYYPLK